MSWVSDWNEVRDAIRGDSTWKSMVSRETEEAISKTLSYMNYFDRGYILHALEVAHENRSLNRDGAQLLAMLANKESWRSGLNKPIVSFASHLIRSHAEVSGPGIAWPGESPKERYSDHGVSTESYLFWSEESELRKMDEALAKFKHHAKYFQDHGHFPRIEDSLGNWLGRVGNAVGQRFHHNEPTGSQPRDQHQRHQKSESSPRSIRKKT